jgi:acetyl esterase/lipase
MSVSGGGGGDPWFDTHADFSKVFLMGDSAGGNIAHRLGMWSGGQDWGGDMRIRGLILLYPYFGGEARTASESEERQDIPTFTLKDSDVRWGLALPVGSNRDHHFCNPLAPHEDVWSLEGPLPPTVMVIGGRDILRDRQLQYCELLKKFCGKQTIEVVVFEEEDHGFALLKIDEQSSIKVMEYASNFIKSAG